MSRTALAVLVLVSSAFAAAGCSDDAAADATVIEVSSGDSTCEVSATSSPTGSLVFRVANTGGQTTEFYLYAAGGEKVVGEVENIGPGITRELKVDAEAGEYVTACKPGMTGDGIRGDFTVTPADG